MTQHTPSMVYLKRQDPEVQRGLIEVYHINSGTARLGKGATAPRSMDAGLTVGYNQLCRIAFLGTQKPLSRLSSRLDVQSMGRILALLSEPAGLDAEVRAGVACLRVLAIWRAVSGSPWWPGIVTTYFGGQVYRFRV